jgi:hypothetical protein
MSVWVWYECVCVACVCKCMDVLARTSVSVPRTSYHTQYHTQHHTQQYHTQHLHTQYYTHSTTHLVNHVHALACKGLNHLQVLVPDRSIPHCVRQISYVEERVYAALRSDVRSQCA